MSHFLTLISSFLSPQAILRQLPPERRQERLRRPFGFSRYKRKRCKRTLAAALSCIPIRAVQGPTASGSCECVCENFGMRKAEESFNHQPFAAGRKIHRRVEPCNSAR